MNLLDKSHFYLRNYNYELSLIYDSDSFSLALNVKILSLITRELRLGLNQDFWRSDILLNRVTISS